MIYIDIHKHEHSETKCISYVVVMNSSAFLVCENTLRAAIDFVLALQNAFFDHTNECVWIGRYSEGLIDSRHIQNLDRSKA